MGGSDGDRSRANTLPALLRADPLWLRSIPQRRRVGASKRDATCTPRRHKLDPAYLLLIASLKSQGRTLREIAAEVGVSHETVRTVLRAHSRHYGR
jgi:DNA-binding NarL/FixJ family response regulator